MHNVLAVIAGLIAFVSVLPYIRDTLNNKTRPNVITWFIWTLINAIISIAAFSGHAVQTGIFAGGFAVCTSLVVVFGLKRGVRHYSAFDISCFILALIGVAVWRLTKNPAYAVLFNVIADLIGVLPTYRHSWKLPNEETWQAYGIGAISAFVGFLSISHYNFLSSAFPIYLFISDVSMAWIINYRRKILKT